MLIRRDFLLNSGMGCGVLALADLLASRGAQGEVDSGRASTFDPRRPLAPRRPHTVPRARSVIWLFMHGAPSQVDTWDYKPELARRDGQELAGFDQSTGFFAGLAGPIMKSPFAFRQAGQSGTWVSEIFPNLAGQVDELAFIHSCVANANNHAPAQFEVATGTSRLGFPCLGSWVTYGLGSENRDLPGFIVMYDAQGRGLPKSRSLNWGAGFLPGVFQGTALNPQGAAIDNLVPPEGRTKHRQRELVDFINRANRRHQAERPQESDLAARIDALELAYRMQLAAPEVLSFAGETEAVHQLYGLDDPRTAPFGRQTLLARRLVERGVRFVQIYSGGFDNDKCWDGHDNIDANHRQFAGETDRPIAGLIADLKSRGLLDSTLVVCCGEFGRLPLVQKGGTGRDHNPHAFTTWFAGGGVRGGTHYGATDELGLKAVENRVSIHDLHATILHLLGLDHERLTYRHNARDFRLTDIAGRIVSEILMEHA